MRFKPLSLRLLVLLAIVPVVAAYPADSITRYIADPAVSKLQFVGNQAGANFTGTFQTFTASVELSQDNLANDNIDVTVDITSVQTLDKDRDLTIRGPDIFDVARFPKARYEARGFTKTTNGYMANGFLTLRSTRKSVPIEFRLNPAATGSILEGSARLKRLDFGVGQGDWKSTEWVKDDVMISFYLILKKTQ